MNNILQVTKLDFYACKQMLKFTSILVILGVVIGVVAHGPEYMMMFMMVFGVTSSGSIFSVYEKSHSETLFGVLPLKKNHLILGRYLFAMIIGVTYVVVAGILGTILSHIMGVTMSALAYWGTLGLAFIYFSFATGVAYPLYFRFTFAKAYVFTMVPMYIIVVLFLVLTRKTDVMSHVENIEKYFRQHIPLAILIGVAGGILLLGLSALISHIIYKTKEL